MIYVKLTAVLALCVACSSLAGCSSPSSIVVTGSPYADIQSRPFPYYVGPSEGWGGRTVSLYGPSSGGSG